MPERSKSFAARSLDEWLRDFHAKLEAFADQKTVVVSVFGREASDHPKANDMNDILGAEFFPSFQDTDSPIGIDVFYALDFGALFLVLRGVTDLDNIAAILEDEGSKEFFSRLSSSNAVHLRLVHYLFVVSHMVLIIEPGCRFSTTLARDLKSLSRLRLSARDAIRDALNKEFARSGILAPVWSKEGRPAIPRFAFALHRNPLRSDIGHNRKMELYERLEEELEKQIRSVLRIYKVIDAGTSNSLGYLPEEAPYVHVMSPSAVAKDSLAELLQFLLNDQMEEPAEEKKKSRTATLHSTFARFVKKNIDEIRADRVIELPTLRTLQVGLQTVLQVHSQDSFFSFSSLRPAANRELRFIELLTEKQIEKAVRLYSQTSSSVAYHKSEKTVFTKAEHDLRMEHAREWLLSVLPGGDPEAAVTKFRGECIALWQGELRGCEATSLTGNNCKLAMHATMGDAASDSSEWELHNSHVSYVATCNCGRSQAVRRDPFTLKEANYDFYSENSSFLCCRDNKERHEFAVFNERLEKSDTDFAQGSDRAEEAEQAVDEERDELLAQLDDRRAGVTENVKKEEEEAEAEDEDQRFSDAIAGLSREKKKSTSTDDGKRSESPPKSEAEEEEAADDESEEDSDKSKEEREPASYLDEDMDDRMDVRQGAQSAAATAVQSLRILAVAHGQQILRLGKKAAALLAVPHSSSPDTLPLFPSWSLLCVGSSTLYSHGAGLRGPGVRHGIDALLPLDMTVQVDPSSWERDLNYVHSTASSSYAKMRRARKLQGVGGNTEKIKLFVGFEYECPRGHRFVVSEAGIAMPPSGDRHRGVGSKDRPKEASVKAEALLASEQSIWMPCTCRAQPSVNAQLMRIHVVTAKAPVTVFLHPRVQVSDDDEGFFHPGEQLKLTWSRYYILRLPYVYSNAEQGPVKAPSEVGRHGRLLPGCLSVSYTPLLGWAL